MSRILSVIGAMAIGAAGMWLLRPNPPEPPPPSAPLISVQEMGHLASLKVNYSDVIEFTQRLTQGIPWTQWELRLGGTRVLLVARGDCLVGTDLRMARYENKNASAQSVVLVLSTPTLISARINHAPRDKGGSYFYSVTDTGLEPLIPGSANREMAINSALARAQQEVERACNQPDIVAAAKKNAEDVLRPTLSATGWKVQITWR
jgi:hypothetical protein